MRIQNSGLLSLLFMVATAVKQSSSSSQRISSSITKTVSSASSSATSSSFKTSTTSSFSSPDKSKTKTKTKIKTDKSSTAVSTSSPSPSPPPPTFYLTINTPEPGLNNTYLRLFVPFQPTTDPYWPAPIPVIQAGLPNPTSATTFSLTPAGYLICNTATGPLYASFYGENNGIDGQEVQLRAYDDPTVPDASASVLLTCEIAAGVLSCVSPKWWAVNTFFLSQGYVVNDAPDEGHLLHLDRPDYPTPMITVMVVPA